jgi:hypothetical protein
MLLRNRCSVFFRVGVIRLPDDWRIDVARLKRKWPKIAALWALEKTIGTRAFGPFPSIDVAKCGALFKRIQARH